MARPTFAFSLRRLMVAVAIAGLAFPAFRAYLLNQRYQLAAVSHRASAAVLALELKNMETIPVVFSPELSPAQRSRIIANNKVWADRIRNQLEYDELMGAKYEQAASRPLSSLPPDPARPE